MGLGHLAAAQVELLLGQDDDRAALGGLIGQRSELGGVGQALRLDAGRGDEGRGHAVAERDGAGLVEQQHVHVAGRFDGPAAGGHDVAADEPVNAADADGAEQAADGGGDQADQQRDQHGHGEDHAGVDAERLQGHADQQEDERQRRQQNRQRDFVRGLLAPGALDHGDHAVQEGVAFLLGDANDDAVADDPRAAGDGAAVAAALADDRRGFAGDGRFVHAGDAFDHIAVGRDDVAGLANDQVAFLQLGRGHLFFAPVAEAAGDGVLARLAQAVGLGFAAAFGDRFGEIGEQDGEPQPEGQLRDEAALGRRAGEDARRGQHRADHGDEHDRVLDHQPRIELLERVPDGRADDVPVKERGSFVSHKMYELKSSTGRLVEFALAR